jgi:tetratricopeptide (TPR) repeat protein
MNAKQIIIAGTLLVSVATFAQKDELKALKKIYAKPVPSANEMVEYKANIAKLETLASEEGDKVYTGFYKAMLPIMEITALGPNITQVQMMKFVNQKAISDLEKGLNATLDYEKKTGKKIQTDDINETIMSYKPQLLAYADALLKAQKYKESAETLYSIYLMDKKDADNLYYAASFAVSGKENDLAIAYYQELKNINYTGDSVQYFATLKATGSEEFYNSKSDRDNLVRLGTHEKPRDVKGESKRPEILKNLAILLADKGRDDEAKAIYAEARKASPDDVSLILGEADLFYKLKDMDSYKKAIEAALVKNPNDADLNYNLGVMSLNANNIADAEKYYKRAIEIDPTYINAYLNFSAIKLMPDAKLVKDMNALGTTEKELKKYNVLKAEREKIFKEALPLLEKAYEIQPENETVKSNLLSVYNFLEMTDKYKALKAKK